jgi:hypothetical protein
LDPLSPADLIGGEFAVNLRNFKRNGKTIDVSGKTIYAPYEYEEGAYSYSFIPFIFIFPGANMNEIKDNIHIPLFLSGP